jgi:hypothetical protein
MLSQCLPYVCTCNNSVAFEWDPEKARESVRKHNGVRFEESAHERAQYEAEASPSGWIRTWWTISWPELTNPVAPFGYQTLINEALSRSIDWPSWEALVRRAIREELKGGRMRFRASSIKVDRGRKMKIRWLLSTSKTLRFVTLPSNWRGEPKHAWNELCVSQT